jgi:hypothetical protein
LTYSNDKLIALSGAAMEIQPILNDTYLAGLWKNHLSPQLLWHVDRSIKLPLQGHRVQSYRAPTWSWASIEGAISYPPPDAIRHNFVDVLDAQITVASPTNIFGQVTGGYVRLEGQLIQLPLMDSTKFHAYLQLAKSAASNISHTWQYDDEREDFECCYGLPLVEYMCHSVWGLVLVATGPGNVEFKKVGVFSIGWEQVLQYLGGEMPEDWDFWGSHHCFDRSTLKSIITIV